MSNKPFRNHHCFDPAATVIDYACGCCEKCYLFVTGHAAGTCPCGGPFDGYAMEDGTLKRIEHDDRS